MQLLLDAVRPSTGLGRQPLFDICRGGIAPRDFVHSNHSDTTLVLPPDKRRLLTTDIPMIKGGFRSVYVTAKDGP